MAVSVKYRGAFDPLIRSPSPIPGIWGLYDSGLRGIDLSEASPRKGRSRLVLYLEQNSPAEPFIKATAGMHDSNVRLMEPLPYPMKGSTVRRLIVERYHYPIHSLVQDLGRHGLINQRQQEILLPEYFTPSYKRKS